MRWNLGAAFFISINALLGRKNINAKISLCFSTYIPIHCKHQGHKSVSYLYSFYVLFVYSYQTFSWSFCTKPLLLGWSLAGVSETLMDELLVPFGGWISCYMGIMIFFKYKIDELLLLYFLFGFLSQMLKSSYQLQVLALSHLSEFLTVKVFLMDLWLLVLKHNFPSTSL